MRWAGLCCLGLLWLPAWGQETVPARISPALRARRFLAGRAGGAAALDAARREHMAMLQAQVAGVDSRARVSPRLNPLSASWTAVGPARVASQSYGDVTGRVTSVAIDPADATGNTVYLGTTGGGVWKSTNAAGAAGSVTFVPLTDTLPVFNANAAAVAIPSLSIGAVSVSPAGTGGVVLAGTGDPNDALDSYYGEGILRSADGGVTWTLTQQSNDGVAGYHSFVGLGTAGFAWSGATQGRVVAAISQAAEGVLVNAPNAAYSVMGLYYSTDAGVTWQMATVEDGTQFVQRPSNPGVGGNAATAVVWNGARQRFYAAVRFHGYYESLDGITWTRLANQPGTGLTATACPTNPGTSGSLNCPIFRGALAVQAATGDTFALTVDANNLDQGLWQDVCAAASAGASCAAAEIAFGTRLPSGPLEVGNGSTAIAQADYNLALAAVATGSGPTADTLVFAGTLDLYRCSLAAGCVLRNTTNAENGCAAPAMVSSAQHGIATLAGAGAGGASLLYIANDGGAWRSVDGVNQQQTPCSADDATHFQNLNGGLGSLGEVVGMAQDPAAAATVLVGLDANGTASSVGAIGVGAGAGAAWPQIAAGEGGAVEIDQGNPLNWYVSTAAGVSVRYCGKGASCGAADFAGTPTIGYAQVNYDPSLIAPPMLLDPALGSDLLIGTCRAWRGPAQSGGSWPGSNAVSAVFGGAQNATCSATANAFARSISAGGPASGAVAAQNAGSTVLYAGMAGRLDGGGSVAGHVFANYAAGTSGGTTAWTDVAKSPVTNDIADAQVFNPGGFDVSAVVADTHDATGKTVYATVMGFAGNTTNAPHVYRSVDGGAHWVNLSSNLPNAPANALLVDPNDANTVYVALDTGIYVTSSVTSCTTANCWSVFGVGLPNAPVVALAAAAGLATGDGRFGLLRAGTYGRGVWEIPLLTAAYPAAPAMTLSPASLTFAVQAVGTDSAPQTIVVTNSGNATLSVTQIAATGDFNETDNCVGASSGIAAGANCSIQVTFLPTATGTRAGVLTVYGNVAGGQATATLTGVGAPAAAIVLTPVSLSFAGTNVGTTSVAQFVTISNTGGITATLSAPAVSGDFTITANTCGATLAANTGCTVGIAFAPTASGTRNGTLTVTDSVGTQTTSLTGIGVLPATDSLAPLALTFGAQVLNTASATQQVTLTNAGDAALTLIAAKIASGDFTVVNGCGNSLIGHASCALQVAFVPKAVGPGTGLMTVTDQFRSQTVVLNGTGIAPAGVSLSPVGSIGFAATGVGLVSSAQTVTLTNNGGVALAIQSMAVTGDFTITAGTNTCGATLAAGAACTAQVVFAPTAAGARTGSFTVTDNAAGSPQSLQLTGVGIDFALTANGPTTATISAGSQAVYGLLLSSVAGLSGTVAFTCLPLPAHATCVVNPAPGALGATQTVSVTIATSVAGAELRWPEIPGRGQTVWLAALLPAGLLALRRRRVWRVVALGGLLLAAGCGSSRLIPATGFGSSAAAIPTPAGSYNVVVAGTSAGLERSVGLTVVVQ
jgi:hypothetical protein